MLLVAPHRVAAFALPKSSGGAEVLWDKKSKAPLRIRREKPGVIDFYADWVCQ